MKSTAIKRAASVVGASAVVTLALAAPSASGSTGVTISPVKTGLNAPRGVAFDGQGSLYVAESGSYLGKALGLHLSQTGKVTKYTGSGLTQAWSTTFDSVYDSEHGAEVLGPEGISAVGSGCMKQSNGQRNGCQVKMIMSESTTGLAANGLPGANQAGHLYRLDGATGVATSVSDVGDQQYQWTSDHASLWQEFPDSNPYGVLVTTDPSTDTIRTFVADAGANTISEVLKDGSNRVIAYIPNDPVRDSTPTCIAQGPDGMLYVGTLDLVFNFVAGLGHSSVWRVDPNANFPTVPTVWATGLTTVTSCTFDRAGNFWATEMFQQSRGAAGPPGDVVKIPFASPTTHDRKGEGQLPVPGGIAQGPDGAMYVSIGSADARPNAGAIVKITG